MLQHMSDDRLTRAKELALFEARPELASRP
jgi:hypothetical protein